jgi:23S rRNA (cytidine1920-2'-O)/16S rRNA (cytidine1409-2'-O)-methyltransferase
MERTNARYLETLDEIVELVTIDVSFISLRLILEAAVKWMPDEREIIALIKPQFEAGKEAVGKGGVVRDVAIHREVILQVLDAAHALNLYPFGLIRSPLKGPKGNVEFLVALSQLQRSFDLNTNLEGVVQGG